MIEKLQHLLLLRAHDHRRERKRLTPAAVYPIDYCSNIRSRRDEQKEQARSLNWTCVCVCYTIEDVCNQTNIRLYTPSLLLQHCNRMCFHHRHRRRLVVFKGAHERAIILAFFFLNNVPCRKIPRWRSSPLCTTYAHTYSRQISISNLLLCSTSVTRREKMKERKKDSSFGM